MKTLRRHLEDKLQDERFHELYSEEKKLAELSLRILETRLQLGLSQQQVAKQAKVTQQQLSRLENGANCNVTTLLKVCNALGVSVQLEIPEVVEEPVA
jgi:transcriptional regulator with XRE-family HTH domain